MLLYIVDKLLKLALHIVQECQQAYTVIYLSTGKPEIGISENTQNEADPYKPCLLPAHSIVGDFSRLLGGQIYQYSSSSV